MGEAGEGWAGAKGGAVNQDLVSVGDECAVTAYRYISSLDEKYVSMSSSDWIRFVYLAQPGTLQTQLTIQAQGMSRNTD